MEAVSAQHRIVAGSLRSGFLFMLGLALFLSALASMTVGAFWISPGDVVEVLAGAAGLLEDGTALDRRAELVVLSLRGPRTVTAIMVGASLGTAGAVLQGLFRNPLADPALIGVSSGAGFAAATMIVLGGGGLTVVMNALGPFALPAAAFLGGVVTSIVLYRVSARHGHVSVATMLLAGIAIGALANAGTGMMIFSSNDEQLRDLSFWLLGSVSGATWPTTLPLLLLLPLFLVLMRAGPNLNRLLLGATEARMMGVDVKRLVASLIVAVALCVGASVAVAGVIGFVGIVVPHIIRLVAGPDHRVVLPASMLFGGILMLVADMVARTVVAPTELPVGIITALMGAPVFLGLLRSVKQHLSM